jgi:hypothetical protein
MGIRAGDAERRSAREADVVNSPRQRVRAATGRVVL